MKTFCTILFFLSLTFFSFEALVYGIIVADKYIFSLPSSVENSQPKGHLLNLDHEYNDQICNQITFAYSPGKGTYIVTYPIKSYYFDTPRFPWHPPEKS